MPRRLAHCRAGHSNESLSAVPVPGNYIEKPLHSWLRGGRPVSYGT